MLIGWVTGTKRTEPTSLTRRYSIGIEKHSLSLFWQLQSFTWLGYAIATIHVACLDNYKHSLCMSRQLQIFTWLNWWNNFEPFDLLLPIQNYSSDIIHQSILCTISICWWTPTHTNQLSKLLILYFSDLDARQLSRKTCWFQFLPALNCVNKMHSSHSLCGM